MKVGTAICIRCDKCNTILINGTINLLNTRIQDATCDTCMMTEAEADVRRWSEKSQSDVEVVSREGVKEIEDRFKSDMRVIKVITNIIK